MSLFGPRHRHGEVLEVEGCRVVLKANPRARRVSIRIDAAKGVAVAVAPSERRLAEAVSFARERAQWIRERLAARPDRVGFAPGAAIPLEGATVRLEAGPGRSAARMVRDEDGARIVAGGEGDAFARRVERLLRGRALEQLSVRTAIHAATLGLKPPRVGLGDPKSRWGSCTPGRGTIRYSWRLILAPPEVLDYVAAHEVAHLVHADHSARFWAVVRQLVGDEKAGRRWLRANGAALHRIG